jgi:hypothetical protein
MIYGVFTLHVGRWRLHGTFESLINAKQEAAYLTDMLGLTARVFVKA